MKATKVLSRSDIVGWLIIGLLLIAVTLIATSCDSPSARHAREWKEKSSQSVSTVNHNRGTIVLANDTVLVISADKSDTITVIVGSHTYDVYSTEDYTVIDHVKR
jgi:hypothetical protein